MSVLPLNGQRVLVTRASHQSGQLSDGLRALGAEPVEVPVIEIRPPSSLSSLDAALRRFDQYNWLVLTSANTVRALAERASQLEIVLDQPATMRVAAVGQATAAAAVAAGFQVTFMPEFYVAENLLEGMKGHVIGRKVLLARASVARDVIPEALRAEGAELDVADAYRNALPEATPALLRRVLEQKIDAATFTSSSSVTHLEEAARRAWVTWPLEGVRAVSIGARTSLTLRELKWLPAGEANQSDIPGLIEAVVRVLRG
jgi:uroporphyrinogen-III synthase